MNPDRGRVVIAGGTGAVGTSLVAHLRAAGFECVILTRGKSDASAGLVNWDARTLGTWSSVLDTAAALVNLVGRSVDCNKTPDNCDEILRSRVESTLLLGRACGSCAKPPPVWVQMSTAHIYGDPPSTICDETSATGWGLAPDVGRAWEAAFEESRPPITRGVTLRTSFVLTSRGGALARLVPLARFGLGGTIAGGTQGMSWIHETDFNRIVERAINDTSMNGAYVVTAPNPVSNRVFMQTLRRCVKQPIGLPASAWMVRLGAAWVLKTDPELALYGRYCVPSRLLREGFEFEFSEIERALKDVVIRRASLVSG